MSNPLVGTIYQRIIADVIENSQVDFEEGGVDASVLEDLRGVWQQKLTDLKVAQFPWDPPPPVETNTPTVPSNGGKQGNSGNIKGEDYEEKTTAKPLNPALNNPQAAAQRAADLLQQKFGQKANNSISTMQQSGMGISSSQPGPSSSEPKIKTESGLGGSQLDGAGDLPDSWDAVMVRRNALGEDEEVGRLQVDGIIRSHVEAMGQRLEGGGLMVPLSEKSFNKKNKARKALNHSASAPSSSFAKLRLGGDAADDDDEDEDEDDDDDDLATGGNSGAGVRNGGAGAKTAEVDEDAINSDLDDPDEEDNFLGGDEVEGVDGQPAQVMLCMYDKVQRVKNKWKCTLKDGVLTVMGKEYVFHKANGELEW